jgi:hypothetical protein
MSFLSGIEFGRFFFLGLATLDLSYQRGVGREQEFGRFGRRHFEQNLLVIRNLRDSISSYSLAGIGELSKSHRFTNPYIRNINFGKLLRLYHLILKMQASVDSSKHFQD